MSIKQHVRLILEEIESVGGVVDRVRHGKHVVVFWTYRGHKFVLTTSSTPSDPRAARNRLAQIRAQARSAVSQNSEAPCVA